MRILNNGSVRMEEYVDISAEVPPGEWLPGLASEPQGHHKVVGPRGTGDWMRRRADRTKQV